MNDLPDQLTEEQKQDLMNSFIISPTTFINVAFEPKITLEPWQKKILEVIEGCILHDRPCKLAVSAGHGVGKTAFISWIIIWYMITRNSPQIIVTANTHAQLHAITWKELAKWHNRCIFNDLCEWQATKYIFKQKPETWHALPRTWNVARPEAFAGVHGDDVMFIFDEASSIDNIIWETVKGAMTSGNRFWLTFGNPTRNSGGFYKCFHPTLNKCENSEDLVNIPKFAWINYQIDSRNVSLTDKDIINSWEKEYGEDSDFFRVRVKGEFPEHSINQLIAKDKIIASSTRKCYYNSGLIAAGIDVASGSGANKSILVLRKGWEVIKIFQMNVPVENLHLKVMDILSEYNVSAICIDSVAIGIPVYNRLLEIYGVNKVTPVAGGAVALESNRFTNRRAEVYFKLRDFINDERSCIPNNEELIKQLEQIEYYYDNKERFMLPSKQSMRSKGIMSPDITDALAYTFAISLPFETEVSNNFTRQINARSCKILSYLK